ncbi:MAG: hypothetical protein GX358_04115 [candidate division WS1 bacterium]|nr:hypothetical protein [candidate division WS1 bacterium]
MRYSIVAVALAIILIPFHTAQAQQRVFFTPPLVTAPVMPHPPTIDGLVKPEEWAGAGAMSGLILLGGQSEPKTQTEIWVGYDDEQLYIGAIMHDPEPDKIKSEATVRDGLVCEDDCLQLFFDPSDTGDKYIHLAINPAGTRYDALDHDSTVDYRWEVKTATVESGWSAELTLPFEGAIAPSPGAVWGFAAGRFVPHMDEKSCSTRILRDFHEFESLGKLMFMPQSASMKMATMGVRSLGENTAVLAVKNNSAATFTGKANVRLIAPTSYGDYYGAEKISITPGKTETVRVPYRIAQDGANLVQFSLTDAEGRTISRTPPYPVMLPPVGMALGDLETALAGALRVWSVLDESAFKQESGEQLTELLEQWWTLNDRYRTQRRGMTTDELAQLEAELLSVTADAHQFREQLDAHIQTHTAGLQIHAIPVLADPDTTPGASRPFTLARLHAARNSRAAMQLVMAPFSRRPRAE